MGKNNVEAEADPLGKFTRCDVCVKPLAKKEPKEDPESLWYHGYCSTKCASTARYYNYQA